ncbi:hypothetical protein MRB53_038224 [Persea americana]|nr:hypothetical protein MRB53_038224 [Persea americana]
MLLCRVASRWMEKTVQSQRLGLPSTGVVSFDSPPKNDLQSRPHAAKQRPHPRRSNRSNSPSRPTSSRKASTRPGPNARRSSESSTSPSSTPRNSSSTLLTLNPLPSNKWRFLGHLSLADNGLTHISSYSLTPLANTLQQLDLSCNLFTEIPDCLASLTALRSVNLSSCMIDSLRSLSRTPLPAIAVLALRANRIKSLVGIEKLLSLERLDLRDNKIADPTELARLTDFPEFREVYVARNDFVKTHPNYRVTIFNLFRASPLPPPEDILIDHTGPGYSERRQLIDRAPEKPSVPVIKPASEEASEAQLRPVPDEPMTSQNTLPEDKTVTGESTPSPSRRRAARRRVIEISKPDHARSPSIQTQPQTVENGSYDTTDAISLPTSRDESALTLAEGFALTQHASDNPASINLPQTP